MTSSRPIIRPRFLRPTGVVSVFLALHAAASYLEPGTLWGVDFLRYHPGWVQGLFVVASVLLLLPWVRQRLIDLLFRLPASLDPWHSRRSFVVFSLILVLASLLAFVSLRSATFLLGDGLFYLTKLDQPMWASLPGASRAPLAFWTIHGIDAIGRSLWHSTENTFRTYSYVSGLLYVIVSLSMARSLGRSGTQRTVILAFLLTPGFTQLFFGYVEFYPLLFPGILLYLLLGLHVLRGRLPLWTPAALLGILIAFHGALGTLFPSLVVLAILQARERPDDSKTSRWRSSARALAEVATGPLLALLIVVLLGHNPLRSTAELSSSNLLPLFSGPSASQSSSILSFTHLLDLLNQYLLVIPSALMVPFLRRKGLLPADRYRTFLIASAMFPVIFSLVANPGLGAFRDWDALAFPALPVALWAALCLIARSTNRTHLSHSALLVLGAALLHSLVWIGLNAQASASVARFTDLTSRQPSASVRAPGWRALSDHHRRQGRMELALGAYKQAIEADPENARQWYTAGVICNELGRPRMAVEHLEKAVALDPRSDLAHHLLGSIYYALGEYGLASDSFDQATQLQPGDAGSHIDLGSTYYQLGKYTEAEKQYAIAVSLDPALAIGHTNLGSICLKRREHEAALMHYTRAVEIDPMSLLAQTGLGNVYLGLGQYEKAVQHFTMALTVSSQSTEVRTGLAYAYSQLASSHHGLGELDQAIDCYERVIALRPDLADAYSNVAAAYYSLGRYAEAIDRARKATELEPGLVVAYLNMGSAYRKLRKNQLARSCYEKVIELDPSDPQADMLRDWLRANP